MSTELPDYVGVIDLQESSAKRRAECNTLDCEAELDVIIAPLVVEVCSLPGKATKNGYFRRLHQGAVNLGRSEVSVIIKALDGFFECRPLADTACGTCSKTAKGALIQVALSKILPRLGEAPECAFCPLPGCEKGIMLHGMKHQGIDTAMAEMHSLCGGCMNICEVGDNVLTAPCQNKDVRDPRVTESMAVYPTERFPGGA